MPFAFAFQSQPPTCARRNLSQRVDVLFLSQPTRTVRTHQSQTTQTAPWWSDRMWMVHRIGYLLVYSYTLPRLHSVAMGNSLATSDVDQFIIFRPQRLPMNGPNHSHTVHSVWKQSKAKQKKNTMVKHCSKPPNRMFRSHLLFGHETLWLCRGDTKRKKRLSLL